MKEITEENYVARGGIQHPGPFESLGYYLSDDETLMGVLTKCSYDKDFNWVVVGPDLNGDWRAITMGTSYPDMTDAFKDMEKSVLVNAGKSVYPQGDES